MREPLKFELYGNENDPNYLRLYECEHLTDGTMHLASEHNIIHVGEHSSISLCKHCAQHMVGMVTEELVRDALKRIIYKQFDDALDGPSLLENMLKVAEKEDAQP